MSSKKSKSKCTPAAKALAKSILSKKFGELIDEYESLDGYGNNNRCECAAERASNNRYRDIDCHESTRVVLKGRPKDADYIHANWVTAGEQRYILAQGPLPHTIEDFWYMIAQEKVGAMIMLCDFVEDAMPKCADYWPHDDGATRKYDDMEVSNISVGHSTLDQVQVTVLKVQRGTDPSLLINHYHWLGWPDEGVPDDFSKPFRLLDLARDCVKPVTGSDQASQKPAPIVVHCSAGIGRSGTLVAIDVARSMLAAGKKLSVVKLIVELRNQRKHVIQGPIQYVYLNACLVQYCMDVDAIEKRYEGYAWMDKCKTFIANYRINRTIADSDKAPKKKLCRSCLS